jgi:hypothetical protein
MGRELWAELSAIVSLIERDFVDNPDFSHATAVVVRCHLWATLHDRPTSWACDSRNWDRLTRPRVLPSQPTMSRRLRSPEFEAFMRELERRASHLPDAATVFKRLDGKPLPISAHTTDPDARWGHGAGQMSKGYKLHAIWCGRAMPLCWRVASMKVSEQEMARRMLRELDERGLHGHVAADAGYDVNPLYHAARQAGNPLLAPRRKPGTGLGHRAHASDRVRAVELTEGATSRLSGMGASIRRGRTQVERDFGNLVSFAGGLSGTLPAWVRRHGRVRRWVWAKLLIIAARIRLRERKYRWGE